MAGVHEIDGRGRQLECLKKKLELARASRGFWLVNETIALYYVSCAAGCLYIPREALHMREVSRSPLPFLGARG